MNFLRRLLFFLQPLLAPLRSHGGGIAILLGLTCLFFREVIVNDVRFAYRDAGLFYYPLFQWTTWEWGRGSIPLWNPLEGWGMPLLADATSSLFYPGKLLFCLPFPFSRLFAAYCLLHLLLAAAGMIWLTRSWRCSYPAATLAAIAYTFGGSIFFQHTNVVFLVGAAWLPWGVYFLWRLLISPTRCDLLGLSAVMSLMTLGGDPQLVVHLGLAALLGCFMQRKAWWFGPRGWRVCGGLSVAFLAAWGLAAVQVLPSAAHLPETDRAVYEHPRTIYEAVATPGEAWEGICGVPAAETHHARVYDFSIGPWRWLELFVPNVGGRLFPQNQRWFSLLPAENGVWTPSLYMGLASALWGLSALRWRRGGRRVRWLTWLTIFFAIGSLGWFGGGWLFREVANACGWQTTHWSIGQPTGGLYWLLATFLPGYIQFRYPAKLWTFVALGLACLAAQGFDRWLRKLDQPERIWGRLALAPWGLALLANWMLPRMLDRDFSADPLWGPFQGTAAAGDVSRGCLQAAVILSLLWLVRWVYQRRDAAAASKIRPHVAWWLVLGVGLEIFVANQWQVATVATRDLAEDRRSGFHLTDLASKFADQSMVRTADPTRFQNQIPRHDPGDWRNDFPAEFTKTSSPNRVAEAFLLDRERGYGRWHLLDQRNSLRPYTTFRRADNELWLQIGGRIDFIPRVWSVSRTEFLPPLSNRDSRELPQRRSRIVRVVKGLGENPTAVAFVENSLLAAKTFQPVDQVELLHEEGNEVRVAYVAQSTSCLVLNIAYDAGWHAELVTVGRRSPLRVERANRVMCAVIVPPGEHRVYFRYRPREFVVGGILSSVSWLIWLILLLREWRTGKSPFAA